MIACSKYRAVRPHCSFRQMITRPRSRPQSLLRALVKQTQHKPSPLSRTPFQQRSIHSLPQWGNIARQEFFARHGVPGFLSAETYQETYVEYSQHLLNQLNELTMGTVDEDTGTHHLHIKYAHRSDKAHLYNISAMLSFTKFFWQDCLTESEDPAVRKPGIETTKSIISTFGSVDALREEMLETADAMFGNGFVWLMKSSTPGEQLKLLATYNAGSPYPEAAPRRDDRDMATAGIDGSLSLADQLTGRSHITANPHERDIRVGNTTAGSFGDSSSAAVKHYKGLLDMEPILCVNVWEHQWLRDWGLTGKKAYLTAWWDRIDWQKVEAAHAVREWMSGGSYQPKANIKDPYARYGNSSVLDEVPRARI